MCETKSYNVPLALQYVYGEGLWGALHECGNDDYMFRRNSSLYDWSRKCVKFEREVREFLR